MPGLGNYVWYRDLQTSLVRVTNHKIKHKAPNEQFVHHLTNTMFDVEMSEYNVVLSQFIIQKDLLLFHCKDQYSSEFALRLYYMSLS